MAIRAVVFDIGNVLIEWQPERFFDRVIGVERRMEFFDAIDLHGMNDRVDIGENFHDVLAQFARIYPDFAAELGIWHDRWVEMAAPAIDHSVRLLRALRRAGHPVLALTNFGIETFEIAQREYPFLEEFDHRYISGEMKVIKPDPTIYERVEAHCGLPPDTFLFTDDRIDNIAAAKARAWQTHHFETSKGWADRLVKEGLLTPGAAQ